MASHAIEIARREWTEFRPVHLILEDDGAIKLNAKDIGTTVTQIWADDDYDFWVRMPTTSVSKLAFELLCEKFVGRLGAVDTFRDWCRATGVEHEFDSWTSRPAS